MLSARSWSRWSRTSNLSLSTPACLCPPFPCVCCVRSAITVVGGAGQRCWPPRPLWPPYWCWCLPQTISDCWPIHPDHLSANGSVSGRGPARRWGLWCCRSPSQYLTLDLLSPPLPPLPADYRLLFQGFVKAATMLHGFVKTVYGFVKVVLCFSAYPFAKQNQAEVWPRFQILLKLLFWIRGVQWVKVLNALGPLCLLQCFYYVSANTFITQASTRYQYKHVERVFGGA